MGSLGTAVISAVSPIATAAFDAGQASRRGRQTIKANNAELALANQQMALAHRIAERQRKRRLLQQTATARAKSGARGTSIGGSIPATIAGLVRTSAREGGESARQRVLGLQASLLNVRNRNRAALLKAAEARERAIHSAAKSTVKTATKLIG